MVREDDKVVMRWRGRGRVGWRGRVGMEREREAYRGQRGGEEER